MRSMHELKRRWIAPNTECYQFCLPLDSLSLRCAQLPRRDIDQCECILGIKTVTPLCVACLRAENYTFIADGLQAWSDTVPRCEVFDLLGPGRAMGSTISSINGISCPEIQKDVYDLLKKCPDNDCLIRNDGVNKTFNAVQCGFGAQTVSMNGSTTIARLAITLENRTIQVAMLGMTISGSQRLVVPLLLSILIFIL